MLLLDHININHQKGRHDLLKAFYFDFLKCSIDSRKLDNYQSGRKTVWANVGMHQFHLPEGKPDAQVFDGMITLVHSNLEGLMERYNQYLDGEGAFVPLVGTEFDVIVEEDGEDIMMIVNDPWGTQFCILPSDDVVEDRAAYLGEQPLLENHELSEGLCLEDLTVYVPHDANLEGIGRFYQYVLGAPTVDELTTENQISIAMGDRQTLTFQHHPDGEAEVAHHDLTYEVKDDEEETDDSRPFYPSNHGPHISMYVTNLPYAYQMAEKLDVLYVNPRFKRRAYSEGEAIDQCMFRILDIVDPLDETKGVILRLEHEIRSTKTRDGKKYKSCPLFDV